LAALVATEPDRTKLRTQLANMVDNVPDSPDYNYWLARYAIMAGDYTTAKNAADALADRIDLLTKLEGILDPWRKLPLHPEIPHPENFYSYREDLVDQDQLAQLTAELDAFTVDEYAAYRSKLDLDPVTVDTAWFDKARPAV